MLQQELQQNLLTAAAVNAVIHTTKDDQLDIRAYITATVCLCLCVCACAGEAVRNAASSEYAYAAVVQGILILSESRKKCATAVWALKL